MYDAISCSSFFAGDGKPAVIDAMNVFYDVNNKAKLSNAALPKADFNQDGIVNVRDAMQVFYKVNHKG